MQHGRPRWAAMLLAGLLAMPRGAAATPPPIVPNAPLTLRPPPVAEVEAEPRSFAGMLAAHNAPRRALGLPPLQWSAQAAEIAQGWARHLQADHCRMYHSGTAGVGENLAWASGQHLSVAQVVAMWVDEARDYSLASNSCRVGAMCGHYTQVVWRGTRFVGCAMARCADSEIWVCNYSPPGNYVGQRPY